LNGKETNKKEKFAVYATTMDCYNVFYGSLVMEISNLWASTVIVGKRQQYIILCKEPENVLVSDLSQFFTVLKEQKGMTSAFMECVIQSDKRYLSLIATGSESSFANANLNICLKHPRKTQHSVMFAATRPSGPHCNWMIRSEYRGSQKSYSNHRAGKTPVTKSSALANLYC